MHENEISNTLLGDEDFVETLFRLLPEMLYSENHKDEAIGIFKKVFSSGIIRTLFDPDGENSVNPIFVYAVSSSTEDMLNNDDSKVKMESAIKELLGSKDVDESIKRRLRSFLNTSKNN